VHVEVVDPDDNFLRLTRDGRTEYVKQATRTSADTYISALIMENKEVTKRVLRDHGLPVPDGFAVRSLEEAAPLWERFTGRGVVVKPRSTNFGQGVTLFRDESWREHGPAADALALDLLNHQTLHPDRHFDLHDGGIYLNLEGRRRYYVAYERRLERPFTSEQTCERTTLRQEILRQVHSLKRAIRLRDPFEPFLMN